MTPGHLLVAGLNLRKGLANATRRPRFLRWLIEVSPDILLIQETQSAQAANQAVIPGYRRIAGDLSLTSWARDGVAARPVGAARWYQTLEAHGRLIGNVHLSPSSGRERADQLSQLLEANKPGQELDLLAGDFNLAPRRQDGIFGDRLSTFTSGAERSAFRALLDGGGLVDVLAEGEQEFTFERQLRSQTSSFRCDLALLRQGIAERSVAAYDHSPRSSFSDHSAVLVSIPVGAGRVPARPEDDPATAVPAHTAMRRSTASPWAQWVATALAPKAAGGRVLDFGCGHGRDVRFYNESGFHAVGYDTDPMFAAALPPEGTFPVITMLFVLNTIASPKQRLAALRQATAHLDDDGVLLVATRSPQEVERQASTRSWDAVGDGYWSSRARRTFQRGIGTEELRHLGVCGGLTVSAQLPKRSWPVGASALLFRLRDAQRGRPTAGRRPAATGVLTTSMADTLF
ncbi:methyltransferase domain-containing protein [Actinoplanes sp. ATCC 53533]|uniref:methyltransferase domain-containing protein n=1 Tax=Actinoplanes sp. ATCC 53533 TaxID=1288362 RepID=UPI0013159AD7|nr:methyltransferase domain-containing protein [Actinoplanes sp. ATCC 53533]